MIETIFICASIALAVFLSYRQGHEAGQNKGFKAANEQRDADLLSAYMARSRTRAGESGLEDEQDAELDDPDAVESLAVQIESAEEPEADSLEAAQARAAIALEASERASEELVKATAHAEVAAEAATNAQAEVELWQMAWLRVAELKALTPEDQEPASAPQAAP